MRRTLLLIVLFLFAQELVDAQTTQRIVHNLGNGVRAPRALKSVTPTYTPQARAARIQGTVTVEAVVVPDGKVGDLRVTKSELWRYQGKSARAIGTVVLLTPAEVTTIDSAIAPTRVRKLAPTRVRHFAPASVRPA